MAQPTVLPPLVRSEWIEMSGEQFLAWAPPDSKSEWVDGKGIAYVSNSARHVRIVVFLGTLLNAFVRAFDLGEVFFENLLMRLPTRPSGRMPNIFVIGHADRARVREQWFDGPALLAIEVLSEEGVARDLREKREEYERAGIFEYLTIDVRPNRQGFTYLRLDADGHYQPVEPDADGSFHSRALPGFWLDSAWLDQDPPPGVERLLLRIAPEAYRHYLERLLAEEQT